MAITHRTEILAIEKDPEKRAEALLGKIKARNLATYGPPQSLYDTSETNTGTHCKQTDSESTNGPFFPSAMSWLKSLFR